MPLFVSDPAQRARRSVERGEALYKEGKHEAALQAFTNAIELAPKNILALQYRAAVYQKQKKYVEAIADYSSAIALEPDNAMHYYYRGNAYHMADKPLEALADINRSLALDPRNARAVENKRFLTLYIAKQQVSAPENPAKPGARGPADQIDIDLSATPMPRARMNLLWLGQTYLAMLRTTVQEGHANVSIFNLKDEGDDQAADLLKTIVVDIKAGKVTVQDIDWAIKVDAGAGKAEAAFHNGDCRGAIEIYRDALNHAPGCDVYLMSIGACYAGLGALREALRYYERAASISPENSQIARNLSRVRDALSKT